MVKILAIASLVLSLAFAGRVLNPGCYLHGYEKHVHLPNCQSVLVRINACRGFCASYCYPSDYETIMKSRGRYNFTSRAACCSIANVEQRFFTVNCGGEERRTSMFSATECECGLCVEH